MQSEFSHNNSNIVLFDFWSLIDIRLTVLKYCIDKYPNYVDLDKAKQLSIPNLEYQRMYGKSDILSSLMKIERFKNDPDSLISLLLKSNEKDLLSHAFHTLMINLIAAYNKAGNGAIRAIVRCDNEIQRDFVLSNIENTNTIICERSKVDTSVYGRVIVAHYKHAEEFNFNTMMSIIVLKYRENMSDGNMIKPELLINLGGSNTIGLASPFDEDDFTVG